jgi:hypothetical protein
VLPVKRSFESPVRVRSGSCCDQVRSECRINEACSSHADSFEVPWIGVFATFVVATVVYDAAPPLGPWAVLAGVTGTLARARLLGIVDQEGARAKCEAATIPLAQLPDELCSLTWR